MAGRTGLEPATSGVTGRRSNQIELPPRSRVQYRTPLVPAIAGPPAYRPTDSRPISSLREGNLSSRAGGEAVYVRLPARDPLESRIRAVLREPFEPTGEAGRGVDVRVVGPAELNDEGPKLLRRLRLRHPQTPTVVLLPCAASAETVRDCYQEKAAEVVFTEELETALPRALFRAVERARTAQGEEETAAHMALELGSRARKLAEALDQLIGAYDETLAALVAALDSRERETACHSQRVAAYSVLLGMRIGVTDRALESLYRGSLLHDIGKIGIPDAILLKPGRLEPGEWEVIRQHPEIGASILGRISFLGDAVEVPLAHHEAWDGSGYPRGLRKEDIPLSARIFAVVDTYDALRSERPYKAAMEHEAVVEIMKEATGQRLDPELVRTFASEPNSTWFRLSEAARSQGTFAAAMRACLSEPGR